jgi:hypothetical protein
MAAHLGLNLESFDLACRAAQLTSGESGRGRVSNAKVAEFLGLAENTVRRVRNGDRAPGGDFIASAIKAFEPWDVKFEQIFTVDVGDEPGAAA